MRTLVIGDIHGCSVALDALLGLVQPAADDRLITLGDYVDRGPDSRAVVDRLIELFDAGRLIALRGNHDEMMLRCRCDHHERRLWLRFGGVQTLDSYGHWPSDEVYDRVPERHWQFLEKDCCNWYETQTHLFAHALIVPNLPMAQQETSVLLWERLHGPVAHSSGKILICGHTRQDAGLPLDLGTTICIDTGIYARDGWLTCLHVERGWYYQADQGGRTRQGTLEALYRHCAGEL